jgi:butyryl-CoA dehydrogenase
MQGGACYAAFRAAVNETLAASSSAPQTDIAGLRNTLAASLERLDEVTGRLLDLQQRDPDRALANATLYLDATGRIVVAWIWLKQALVAVRALAGEAGADTDFYRGKLQAARYYGEWELPVVKQQFDLLSSFNSIPLDMRDSWF